MRQLIWVLSGSLVFLKGSARHETEEGDCLELGPPSDCVFKNESAAPCTYAVAILSNP
ncbi:hypothetical protein [Microvirga sp. TS319]|uniref:hypothetical protein n=1 Tax=Microvirga sp. TS319 TaxID=3241165 RepID=UPI00351A8479